jgi:hypothetical protein
MTDADWKLMQPYLEENERLFGISVDRLLTVDGKKMVPKDVYRKIGPKKAVLAEDYGGLVEWEGSELSGEEKRLLAARRRRQQRAAKRDGSAPIEGTGEEEDYVPAVWRI